MSFLEAGYDLGGLAGCYLLIGLLAVTAYIISKLARAIDFSILGQRPLHGVATGMEHLIVAGCNDGIDALEKQAARFESGLVDALGLLIGVPLALALGLKEALTYLWDTAIDPRIHHFTRPIAAALARVEADIAGLAGSAGAVSTAVASYVTDHVSAALHDSEAVARRLVEAAEAAFIGELNAAEHDLRHELAAGFAAAQGYADDAVGALRRAEDAAIAHAASVAHESIVTAEQALRRQVEAVASSFASELDKVRDEGRRAIATAETLAAEQVAAARNAAARAFDTATQFVSSEVSRVERELRATAGTTEAQIATAVAAAERTAQEALTQARNDASAQVASATLLAKQLVADAERLASERAAEVEHAASVAVAAASSGAARALASSEAAATAALDTVRQIAITAERDISDVIGDLNAAGVAGLIASIPLLATLVHTIATESGLENSSCRGKVKNVCQTDPSEWASLLGGAAFLTGAFTLGELVAPARAAVGTLTGLIREAA